MRGFPFFFPITVFATEMPSTHTQNSGTPSNGPGASQPSIEGSMGQALQSSSARHSSQLSRIPLQPDVDTAYVTIRRPPNVWALTQTLTAPLELYALNPDEGLVQDKWGPHAAHTLCEMERYTNERSGLLTSWRYTKAWVEEDSESPPWKDKTYQNWEEDTYKGLEENAAKANHEKGENGTRISVVRDAQTLEELKKGGCWEVSFNSIKANAEAASTNASTNE